MKNRGIKYPSFFATSMIVLASAFIAYLGQIATHGSARGFVLIFCPIFGVSIWLRMSNITFSTNRTAAIYSYLIMLIWALVVLNIVIISMSIENGRPIISEGIIFEIATMLANK